MNIRIYWKWEFNENDESSTDSEDASLFYDKDGNSSLDCYFIIQIIGMQSK